MVCNGGCLVPAGVLGDHAVLDGYSIQDSHMQKTCTPNPSHIPGSFLFPFRKCPRVWTRFARPRLLGVGAGGVAENRQKSLLPTTQGALCPAEHRLQESSLLSPGGAWELWRAQATMTTTARPSSGPQSRHPSPSCPGPSSSSPSFSLLLGEGGLS